MYNTWNFKENRFISIHTVSLSRKIYFCENKVKIQHTLDHIIGYILRFYRSRLFLKHVTFNLLTFSISCTAIYIFSIEVAFKILVNKKNKRAVFKHMIHATRLMKNFWYFLQKSSSREVITYKKVFKTFYKI